MLKTRSTFSEKQKNYIRKLDQDCVKKNILEPIWLLIKNNMSIKFKTVLLNYSESEEYEEALEEWTIISSKYVARKKCSRCICSNKINKRFFIVNKLNSNVLCLGSTCINKFKK